jgi:hypothetical protein
MANRKLIWALVAALLVAAPGFAQVQKGSITVTVIDADGAALPGATVSAEAPDALTRRSTVTDEKGQAELPALDPSARYSVTVELEGFGPAKAENVLVKSGQTSPVRVPLSIAAVTESINVTGEAPLVDVTSAQTGQDVTLELTESLPTGRSYQSYLQLVPGVLPSSTGNPAARAGVNFSDVNGVVGQSSDNVYYVEGINVTDRYTGTFGANLNTEIIQEQSVLTGGLPAEYQGAPGLVSNVATKSGGNQFAGSLNYFFQDDSLVADNENTANSSFSTYDTAFTLGGPIARDKAWFFASYRLVNREEDVTTAAGSFLRTVTTDQEQAFGKISWNISQNDLLSVTYLTDPFERDGSTAFTTLNNRSLKRDQGGERYNGRYTRVFGDFVIEANASHHEGEVTDNSADNSIRNNVVFRRSDFPGTTPAASLVQLGGAGLALFSERSNDAINISGDWNFDTSAGSHTIKVGYGKIDTEYAEDSTIPGGAQYTSIDNRYVGDNVTAAQVRATGAFTAVGFDVNNTSDVNGPVGLIANINASPNRAALYALLDVNGDGTLTSAEIGQRLVFNNTAGNPNGKINYTRTLEVETAPFDVGSEGDVAFLQDLWQFGRLSVNAGVRAERTDMINSDGLVMFEFDWEYAPRVSVAYDLFGNGRHRLSAFYGRYYDPLRDQMNDFAGQQVGPVLHEQVFVGGQWITYRVRGGRAQLDSAYAPSTKVPYTDEWMLGYKVDLGQSMSLETTYSRRETRDIFEDFDMCLYAGSCYSDFGDPNAPGTLFLGEGYFGYNSSNPRPTNVNFVLGTLPGGERNYDIAEIVFRKRMSNNWQFLASYTHTDAEGNSNSDSNADFAGDDLQFDPRSPNLFGTLPGSIENLVKLSGSYQLSFGLEVGATYNWNSGSADTPAVVIANRYLPVAGDEFTFNGTTYPWTKAGAVGSIENDSYGTLDFRVSYAWNITDALNVDLYLDVFNVTDDQATTLSEAAIAGRNGIAFGGGKAFVDPQRFYLGARLRF